MHNLTIQKIGIDNIDLLLTFSKEVFFTAFAHLNSAEDMQAYANQAFTAERLGSELNNPHSQFYFGYIDSEPAGYLKINFNSAQTEFKEADAMEIERLYVHASFQNKKVGAQLMQFALEKAQEKQARYVWLGVWEHNINAIRFYERYGFTAFSSHDFWLGNDRQTDLLMRKPL